jgi:lipoprotein-anchoring transpeptidase ErfK/SrfK
MTERVVALAEGSPAATLAASATIAAPTAPPTLAAATDAPTLPPTEPPAFPTKGAVSGGAPLPTWTPTGLPTPTLAPTMTPSPTPIPSPTPTPIPLVVGALSPRPPGVAEGERWINVNLSTQTLVAYEGDVPVFETLVSSGLPQWPTVTGQFRTYAKYESQTMNGYLLGYDYYLPDVPYVMYFYNDYAIHGTYWHSNFGTPMSHGCVNVSTPDAGWLFGWAPMGTVVNVTY